LTQHKPSTPAGAL